MRFNCHINIEICASIKGVKYLYKYLYKGPDKSTMVIKGFDEVDNYVKNRTVSSVEAFYRIRSFKMHNEYPSVFRLPVHLEDNHCVYYDPDCNNDEQIKELLENNRKTPLTEWFNYNKNNDDFRDTLYEDFATKFIWNKSTKTWKRRIIKRNVVVRIYSVSPKDTERFFLKLLLKHVPGATCYDDLKTVHCIKYNSFRDAAIAMKITDTDEHWHNTMQEATLIHMPSHCRKVFAYLLLYCEVSNPKELWSEFKSKLYDDYRHNHVNLREKALENLALIEISRTLNENNSALKDFDLPEVKAVNRFENEFSVTIEDRQEFEANQLMLNDEQEKILNNVNRSLLIKKQILLFIDAPGGSGKTFLLNQIITHNLLKNRKVISVASSGIAAILLKNGRTAHSLFKIPLNINEESVCDLNKSKDRALIDFLTSADLIIWDEAPMMSKFVYEAFDRSMRDICGTSKLFGGKSVIFSGDFRQILPIVPLGSKDDIIFNCIKNASFWSQFTISKLTKNLRIKNDSNTNEFSKYLLDVGREEYHIKTTTMKSN